MTTTYVDRYYSRRDGGEFELSRCDGPMSPSEARSFLTNAANSFRTIAGSTTREVERDGTAAVLGFRDDGYGPEWRVILVARTKAGPAPWWHVSSKLRDAADPTEREHR